MNQADYQRMKENFRDYLRSKQFTHKSIESSITVFNQYLKWTEKENLPELEQVRYNDLLLFMKHCQRKGMSQRTIKHYMIIVRHYYDHLAAEGVIKSNPVTDIRIRGVKRKELYHILEPHELHALYHHYPAEMMRDKRNQVMLGLLVYQGLRTEEIGRLRLNDVKIREGKIDVLGSRKTNGRLMQLEPHQVMDSYDYLLQVRPKLLEMNPKRKTQIRTATEQLFIGEGGNCYNISNFITQLMIKVRKINPQVRNAKQIRASVITKWLKVYNLREVQHLAGHRYISSTESFLQNDMEGLKEEVQQFHPLG